MDGEDWDLAAIVRSCCCSKRKRQQDEEIAAASAGPPPIVEIQIGDQVKKEEISFGFVGGNLETEPSFVDEGLQLLHNPNLLKSAAFKNRTERIAAAPAFQSNSRTKRRKKQLKKVVCQVPADGVSPDVWSWRKYGQKPIKGSPFPRGYYRCSTMRGCPARKQVERDRTNPGQLTITYTSEHNHPTPAHHKLPSTAPSERREQEDRLPISPATSMSTNNDDQEKEQEEEEMLMVEDMEVIGEDELIFVGNDSAETLLDEDGVGFEEPIFASPWFEKSGGGNATAAAC